MTRLKTYTCQDDVRSYTFDLPQIGDPLRVGDDERSCRYSNEGGTGSPSEDLDRRARARMYAYPGIPYAQAVKDELDRSPTLRREYASETAGRVRIVGKRQPRYTSANDPSAALDREARRLMDEGVIRDYANAAAEAVRQNPELGRAWSSFSSAG